MAEIREALRAWLQGARLRKVAERAGVDRKTARRYVEVAVGAGLAVTVAQAKKMLIGVYRLETGDLNAAISWAAHFPIAWHDRVLQRLTI